MRWSLSIVRLGKDGDHRRLTALPRVAFVYEGKCITFCPNLTAHKSPGSDLDHLFTFQLTLYWINLRSTTRKNCTDSADSGPAKKAKTSGKSHLEQNSECIFLTRIFSQPTRFSPKSSSNTWIKKSTYRTFNFHLTWIGSRCHLSLWRSPNFKVILHRTTFSPSANTISQSSDAEKGNLASISDVFVLL